MSYYNCAGDPKLSLKVVINKEKTKVVFAEATNDFIDVLLSFLTFPLGKLVNIVGANIGSLNTLCNGLSNLDISHFCVGGAKHMLVFPKSSFEEECCRLKLDISDSHPTKYFCCQDLNCSYCRTSYISLYPDIASCRCGKPLNREVHVGEGRGDGGRSVFTINPLSFLITDDLRIAPIVTGFLQTLNTLGITDTEGAELRCLSFGKYDILDLLKLSLFSATPLTDLILKKSTPMSSTAAVKPESGISLDHIWRGNNYSKKMVLKVCMQKSTKKLLFAEATNEFVEFLCSLVTVPLGGVEFLLGGNTGLKCIDNLYRSVELMEDKYFRTPETKKRLTNPKLAHGYVSKNQFLPLTEEDRPKLYYNSEWNRLNSSYDVSFERKSGSWMVSSFKSSKGNYAKAQTVCFVSDDLTVTPSLATSINSNILHHGNGIPLSDLKEMEVQIGLEEALKILRASLTSKTPLSDVLTKPMLNKNKLPKLEHNHAPKQQSWFSWL